MKYDDEIQVERLEAKNLQVRGSDNAFAYTLAGGAIAAARTLNLPVITGTDTVVVTTLAQTLASKTLTSPVINTGVTGTAVGTGSGQIAAGDHTHAGGMGGSTGSTDNAVLRADGTGGSTLQSSASTISDSSAGAALAFTLTHTDNSNGASHTVLDASVGGTSGGDPQLRLTIPGGTSWYMGVDNNSNDVLDLGTGTTVGSNRIIEIDGRSSGITSLTRLVITHGAGQTISDSSGALYRALNINSATATLAGTTTVTQLWSYVRVDQLNIAQSGGAVIVNDATQIATKPPLPGTSVTLSNGSGIRVQNSGAPGGTYTAQHGIYIEDMTSGSADFGLTIEGADTAAIWVSSAADNTDAANGIAFGSSRDTNLYRSAANILQTDDSLSGLAGVYIGSSGSTNNLIDDASNGAGSTTLYIGNASINVTSDVRVKDGVQSWGGSGLDLLRRLNVVEYRYHDHRPYGGQDDLFVGFTAQGLAEVAPWTVNYQGGRDCWECKAGLLCEDHQPWQARFEMLTGAIVKGVQELDARVTELEGENAKLRERVVALGG